MNQLGRETAAAKDLRASRGGCARAARGSAPTWPGLAAFGLLATLAATATPAVAQPDQATAGATETEPTAVGVAVAAEPEPAETEAVETAPADTATGEAVATEALRPDAIHNALRTLRDSSLEALAAGDFTALEAHIHPNVVVTAENGTLVRGRDAVRAFYLETLVAPDSYLEAFEVSDFEVDELSILYGDDTAIAFGSANLHYVPRSGDPLSESARWTAVVTRDGDAWQIASFQTTVDFTSSRLLERAVTGIGWYAGAGGGALGLVLGLLRGLFWARRRGTA